MWNECRFYSTAYDVSFSSPDSVSDPSDVISAGMTTKYGCLVRGSVLSLVKRNGARVHKGPRSDRPLRSASFGEPAKMSEHLPTRSSCDGHGRGRGRWGASGPSLRSPLLILVHRALCWWRRGGRGGTQQNNNGRPARRVVCAGLCRAGQTAGRQRRLWPWRALAVAH
ncbi:hypothetical protein MRX96_007511 [Rhipicephalus microplus]